MVAQKTELSRGQKTIFVLYLIAISAVLLISLYSVIDKIIFDVYILSNAPFPTAGQVIAYGILLIAVFALSVYLVYYLYKNPQESNLKRGLFTGLAGFLPITSSAFYVLKFIGDTMGLGGLIPLLYAGLSGIFFIVSTILGLILIKLDKSKFTRVINTLLILFIIPIFYILLIQILYLLSYLFSFLSKS